MLIDVVVVYKIDRLSREAVQVALIAPDARWEEICPAQQALIVQLLIERVDIGTEGLRLRFRDKGLAQMAADVGFIAGKTRKVAA